MSKQVLIIYTGGTIGMVPTEQGLIPSSGLCERITTAMNSHLSTLPSFDVLEFDPLIDSANIHPSHWTQLSSTLSQQWDNYDGFIILHGTDTMSYSASALSFILGACNKNVLLTGSQIPIGMNGSDAISNLQAALSLVVACHIPDVSIVFNRKLIRGNRSQKISSTHLDAFGSPNDNILGTLDIGIQLYPERMLQHDNIHKGKVSKQATIHFNKGAVAVLMMHPDQSSNLYQHLVNNPQCRAIILMSYGAGNVPSNDPDFLTFLKGAIKHKKVVANISQCYRGGVSQGTYATGSILNQYQVLSSKDMTLEAAFCKLHYLIANGESYENIHKQWHINYANEFTE